VNHVRENEPELRLSEQGASDLFLPKI